MALTVWHTTLLCLFTGVALFGLRYISKVDFERSSEATQHSTMSCQRDKLHVMVTGGAGFIGSHAAMKLLQDGESVKEPSRYYRNITTNTLLLLEVMARAGVTKLVYSSTCAVYGTPKTLPVTEETPLAPVSPYGRAKAYAEQEVADFAAAHPQFRAISLRYFNVYGSDPDGVLGEYPREELRRKHPRISNSCMDVASGELSELLILGTSHPTPDGTTIRDYIHVDDLVNAHLMAINHMANPPAIYNIGTGKGTSTRDFVEACKRATGRTFKVIERREARPGDSAAIYADPSKIMQDLGWRPNFTKVEDGLRHAWRWRQANPSGYQ